MTFKDLKLKLARLQGNSNQNNKLEILKGKAFWIWHKQEHLRLVKETNQQCCFQHIVKCPTKAGREYPLFEYQKLIYDTLLTESGSFKDKHLYLLKSTGI